VKARLDYLRKQIRAEKISMAELVELQSMATFIDPGDVELLEWAGVPEDPPATEYLISVSCVFEAVGIADAAEQFAEWCSANVRQAGVRFEWVDEDDVAHSELYYLEDIL
jgi:hypothetical protein